MNSNKDLAFIHVTKNCIALLCCQFLSELDSDFYLWLGVVRFLMSYIGSISALMARTSMKEILEKVFCGVLKMLTGKKYPQNLRALRILMEDVLRPFLKDGKITSHSCTMYLLNHCFYAWYSLELNGKENGHFIWKLLKIWYHFSLQQIM